MTPAEYVRTTRAAQGLPLKVTDPATLAKLAAIIRATAVPS